MAFPVVTEFVPGLAEEVFKRPMTSEAKVIITVPASVGTKGGQEMLDTITDAK